MLKILYYFLSAISGAITGCFFFGAWMALFFYLYSLLFGKFVLFEIAFLGVAYVERPLLEGFIIGGVIGIILGFAAALSISFFNPNTFPKTVLAALLVMEVIIFGFFFLISLTNVSNPIWVFTEMLSILPAIFIISLFFLIPSLLNGATVFTVNRLFSRLLKLNELN